MRGSATRIAIGLVCGVCASIPIAYSRAPRTSECESLEEIRAAAQNQAVALQRLERAILILRDSLPAPDALQNVAPIVPFPPSCPEQVEVAHAETTAKASADDQLHADALRELLARVDGPMSPQGLAELQDQFDLGLRELRDPRLRHRLINEMTHVINWGELPEGSP